MQIEDRLESLDTTLKAILVAIQSGAQITAAIQSAEADCAAQTTPRKRRAKAEMEADAAAQASGADTNAVLPGDPPGTRYWISELLCKAFVGAPGVSAPFDPSFKPASPEHFAARIAEFAAKKSVSTEAASSAPVVQQAAAPAASADGCLAEVTWDQAVSALKNLAQNPAHGSQAVLKLVRAINPDAANVPALRPLGKNAEIVAAVNALLNPAAGAADTLFG